MSETKSETSGCYNRLEIAIKALTEISEMRYKAGGETEEAEIARKAIENINSR